MNSGWESGRFALALCAALLLHAGVAGLFALKRPAALEEGQVVPVALVLTDRPEPEPEPEPPDAEPEPLRQRPEAPTVAEPEAEAPAAPAPAVPATTSPASESTTQPVAPPAPDYGAWAVEGWSPGDGSGATPEPVAAVPDLRCAEGDADCEATRRFVFAETQMTPTEKVWQPQRAWRGLGAEFVGMNDQEVQLALGGKVAGGNRLALLPDSIAGIPLVTNLAIDGPIWDALHGVNKTCGLKKAVGGNHEVVNRMVVRDCGDRLHGDMPDRERFMGTRDDVDWVRKGWQDPDAVEPIAAE